MPVRRMLKRAGAIRREDADAEAKRQTADTYILSSILDKKASERLEDMRMAIDDFVFRRRLEGEG